MVFDVMIVEPAPNPVPADVRLIVKVPPVLPALQTLNSLATGSVLAAVPATANVALGGVGVTDTGANVESEHAAKNAIPNPALAMSATLFICMCVSISSLV